MSETNKTYRIRANAGGDANYLSVQLDQDYDILEILSLKIDSRGAFALHTANYGVVVGRAIANGGVGVPNAKISIFITKDEDDDSYITDVLYPYTSYLTKNNDGIRYNLLVNTDNEVNPEDCHRVVGTFPSKKLVLDDDNYIEIFEKYYKYTTRTNDAGDYMIFGVPTGNHILHMDLDISDCGMLSQRPRDFVYKGYNIEQFENPNQFKVDTELDSLAHIISQNQGIDVKPFWGDTGMNPEIGITRADININFKFETTCVFMGSVFTDDTNNGINKKCVPSKEMGKMSKLTTGRGNIEIIRKTPSGAVEELNIKGTALIDGDGVWCFQIPMNLDYMMTDEYGNLVATDDPNKGIATRARVRFRMSMGTENSSTKYFQAKVLVPNNPPLNKEEYDNGDGSIYTFGTHTNDSDYRDLFWDSVYTVKSYIPRIQHASRGKNIWRTRKFSGIKTCNAPDENNPFPFNHIRLRFPFMFVIMCWAIKMMILAVELINKVISGVTKIIYRLNSSKIINITPIFQSYLTLSDTLCAEMSGTLVAPGMPTSEDMKIEKKKNNDKEESKRSKSRRAALGDLILGTYLKIKMENNPQATSQISMETNIDDEYSGENGKDDDVESFEYSAKTTNETIADKTSTEYKNSNSVTESEQLKTICLTRSTKYLMECVEMNLAEEYEVINFDFYNDWVNGVIYMPRWAREVRKRLFRKGNKVKACFNDSGSYRKTMQLTGLNVLTYNAPNELMRTQGTLSNGVMKAKWNATTAQVSILGQNAGLVSVVENQDHLNVYYFKPCEYTTSGRILLFATDIVLLGHLNNCNIFSIPRVSTSLEPTSYKLPPDLVTTNLQADGKEYTGKGCVKEKDILSAYTKADSGKTNNIINTFLYSGGDSEVSLDMIVSGTTINEELVSATEEAGISWVITGPNQLSKSNDDLYSPGGHFLALACVERNSSTNAKSIINAARMCELGVTTSERIEIEFKRGDKPETHYFVPTGMISKDSIIDNTFRSEFATMNFNGLHTVVDPQTSFLRYEFKYLHPSNFDGAAKSFTSKGGYVSSKEAYVISNTGEGSTVIYSSYTNNNSVKPYNMPLISGQTIAFTPFYYNSKVPDDVKQAIEDESAHTYTRTWEEFDADYYNFRLGIGSGETNDKAHYVMNIPQFENSYYFYFGLKDGNTALDKLNEEFFAVCSPRADVDYPGKILMEQTDKAFGECDKSIKMYKIEITDMEPSYSISFREGRGDGTDFLKDIFGKMFYVAVSNDDGETFEPLFHPVSFHGQPYTKGEIQYDDNGNHKVKLYFSDNPLSPHVFESGKTNNISTELYQYNETPDSFTTTNFYLMVPNTTCRLTIETSQGFSVKKDFILETPIDVDFEPEDFYITNGDRADSDFNAMVPRFGKDEYGRPRPAIGGYLTFILGTGVNLNYLRENHMAIVAIHDSQYAYYGSSEVETPLNSLGLSNALSNINTEITKEIEQEKYHIPFWECPEYEGDFIRYTIRLYFNLNSCNQQVFVGYADVKRVIPPEHNFIVKINDGYNNKLSYPYNETTLTNTLRAYVDGNENASDNNALDIGYLITTEANPIKKPQISLSVEAPDGVAETFVYVMDEFQNNEQGEITITDTTSGNSSNFTLQAPNLIFANGELKPIKYGAAEAKPAYVGSYHTNVSHNTQIKYGEYATELGVGVTLNNTSLASGDYYLMAQTNECVVGISQNSKGRVTIKNNSYIPPEGDIKPAIYEMQKIPYIYMPISVTYNYVITDLYRNNKEFVSPTIQEYASSHQEVNMVNISSGSIFYDKTMEIQLEGHSAGDIASCELRFDAPIFNTLLVNESKIIKHDKINFIHSTNGATTILQPTENLSVYRLLVPYETSPTAMDSLDIDKLAPQLSTILENKSHWKWEPVQLTNGQYNVSSDGDDLAYMLQVYTKKQGVSTFNVAYLSRADVGSSAIITHTIEYISLVWNGDKTIDISSRPETWTADYTINIAAYLDSECPFPISLKFGYDLKYEGINEWDGTVSFYATGDTIMDTECKEGTIELFFGEGETQANATIECKVAFNIYSNGSHKITLICEPGEETIEEWGGSDEDFLHRVAFGTYRNIENIGITVRKQEI